MNELTNERLNRFIDLLKGIFELDKSDLDFGIYRIMNIRKDEIERFLNDGLPKKVTEVLKPFATAGKDELLKRKDAIEKQAFDLGIEIADSPKLAEEYAEVNKALAGGTDLAALETDVYSALYSFFSRYYDEGDFISKRRYKEGVYAIPYEGEEVKLYWANQDQYYVKTSENFKDYVFTAQDWTVHFNLVDATTEQNNNKETDDKKREFMLFIENEEEYPGVKTFECDVEKKELIIRFVFDIPADKKIKYLDENYTKICDFIVKDHKELMTVLLTDVSNDKKNPLTLIQKHLKGYVAKNTFDYFIHKDLGGFLTRELDFFIKNEVMHLDDLDTTNEARVSTYLAKVRAIKQVGKILIEFLAQIENFQKKLWLKKKFVVETNWCITLDKIDESFYEEIRNNKEQVKEWIEMYAIDMANGDLIRDKFTNPLSADFLKQNGKLVVDTKFFSESFKEKLVSSIDFLDEKMNGILIHSENLQALNLCNVKYDSRVKGCYIDPPFNLGENADYLYKVDYKDSTWLALLQDRVVEIKKMLADDGSIFIRCSHDGNMLVRQLMNELYGKENYRNEIVLRRAEETKGDLNKQFESIKSITVNYDNLYWYSKKASARYPKIIKPISSDKSPSHWHSFWKAMDRPTMRYEILGIDLSNHYGQWMWQKTRAYQAVENYKKYQQDAEPRGISLDEYWEETGRSLEFIKRDGNSVGSIKYWIPPRSEVMADTNWLDIKGYANKWSFKTENSEGVVKRVIDSLSNENDIILDCFVGSGTTAAVSLKTKRKFLCVDMGAHFYDVVLPRIKYVLNGESSGVSSEVDYFGGGIIKYMRLESYEDALSNIELQKPQTEVSSLFGDEYLINYMLDIESKGSLLNVKAFKDPFEYSMRITEKNESRLRKVDVVETFNYLIGLTVIRQDATKYFSATAASNPEYEGAVDLKNDTNGKFAFRQIEGSLPDGRRALVIWRNINDNSLESNAALDAYFSKYRLNPQDREYDVIYVNGDNNLENLRTDNESWKVQMIETEFNARMFEEN